MGGLALFGTASPLRLVQLSEAHTHDWLRIHIKVTFFANHQSFAGELAIPALGHPKRSNLVSKKSSGSQAAYI